MNVTEADVRAAALEVYTPEGVDIWYDAHVGQLHGATPRQYVDAGDGEKVLDVLHALATGSFG